MIQPIGKRIVVSPDAPETVTKSGLILPGQKDETLTRGAVVALGSEIENIKIGDKVLFKKYASEEVMDNGETFAILDLDDVLGILI